MSVNQTLVSRFRALFSGLQRSYGTYGPLTKTHESGKRTGDPDTIHQPVTNELYLRHLEGVSGLGIVPIRDDSTCLFGALDIDVYADLDHGKIAGQLQKFGIPIIPCRSKSGGLHGYLFCKSPVPAAKMQAKLRGIAARLGHGNCELFPKQTKLSPNDSGSWINLPYFGGNDTTRYAVRPSGDAMTLEEFLDAAEAAKVDAGCFEESTSDRPKKEQGKKDESMGAKLLPDGPPCLQHLVNLGLPDGTWNTSVFNIGVYARKAHLTGWKEQLVHINSTLFDPKVWSVDDLNGVMKSLDRKTYAYQCQLQPLLGFCDKATCSRRKYGVKSEGLAMPAITGLTKFDTNPPRYICYMDGIGVEVARDELFDYTKFEKICSGQLDRMLPTLKVAAWKMLLNEAMEQPAVFRIEKMPVEASPEGQLWRLLEDFCTGRTQAQSREEILLGKPFSENGETMFRLEDLIAFLTRKQFRDMKSQTVASILKTRGATTRNPRIGKKQPTLWCVPEFAGTAEPLPVADAVDKEGDGF